MERARAIGFELCGVVRAERFPELHRTEEWLARGYGGEMKYLADPRRSNPDKVMEGLRSVIVCALNYNAAQPRSAEAFESGGEKADSRTSRYAREQGYHQNEAWARSIEAFASDAEKERGWISRYAWGQDYHEVLEQKLRALSNALAERFDAPFDARAYVDTGPLNERVLAKHAGLGWLGKNTLLLNSKLGSWFFLGVILTTLELAPTVGEGELPPADLCGSCTRCIEACPTGALVEPYVMDARRCISYLTIELRGSIPEELREPMGRHVFGCDICQDVCPWNRRAPGTQAEEFQPRTFPGEAQLTAATVAKGMAGAASGQEETLEADGTAGRQKGGASPSLTEGRVGCVSTGTKARVESLFQPRLEWLASLTEEQFRYYFRGSPIKRTKWRGLVRNACIALGNSGLRAGSPRHQRVRALLSKLALSSELVIAESARWALARIE